MSLIYINSVYITQEFQGVYTYVFNEMYNSKPSYSNGSTYFLLSFLYNTKSITGLTRKSTFIQQEKL